MNTRKNIVLSLVFLSAQLFAQSVSKVYKTDDLVRRINSESKPLVVNFWATWCKPCIQELPSMDSLTAAEPKIKVLLVALDFREDLSTKVDPFLKKRGVKTECVLLDEVNGNDFINKISEQWTGAIPATLIKGDSGSVLLERSVYLEMLRREIGKIK